MHARIYLGLIWLFLIGAVMPAGARGFFVGRQENLHALEPVALKGPNDGEIMLSFKTSTLFLGLGIYCWDDGYVLTPRNQAGSYYRLPEPSVVKKWQEEGLLPPRMPEYKIPMSELLLGYSLWLFVVPATGVALIHFWKERRQLARSKHPVLRTRA